MGNAITVNSPGHDCAHLKPNKADPITASGLAWIWFVSVERVTLALKVSLSRPFSAKNGIRCSSYLKRTPTSPLPPIHCPEVHISACTLFSTRHFRQSGISQRAPSNPVTQSSGKFLINLPIPIFLLRFFSDGCGVETEVKEPAMTHLRLITAHQSLTIRSTGLINEHEAREKHQSSDELFFS
ncbi:hypothetical protein BaRGS_00016922 [Batillaria attramentaria]|uniref:Uncharacterized protein n=1 Tax=Batillaria attramentaria TaxID=370345 RepID=A0ABD0KXA0_9CAEN